jgi:hypothetical protein
MAPEIAIAANDRFPQCLLDEVQLVLRSLDEEAGARVLGPRAHAHNRLFRPPGIVHPGLL